MTPKSRDLSAEQMEALRRMMESGGESNGLFGLETSEPAEWMRDLHSKQNAYSASRAPSMWSDQTGVKVTQEEAENIAGALRAGNSPGVTKTPWNISEGDVTVSRAPGMGRDQQWWDMKRPLIFGMSAWEGMADLANEEGGRYSASNPYVYTDEMRAADEAALAQLEQDFYYDAATDTTHIGGYGSGMTMKGQLPSKTEADYSAEDWQWLQEGKYYEGHDQITPQAREAIRAAGGGMGLIDVFAHDVTPLLDAFKADDWNPFYGTDRQALIDRQREIGVLGDKKTRYERRWDNNVMDYLYENFTAGTDAATRKGVSQAWGSYLKKQDKTHRDYYQRRMTEKMFKDIGLDKFGEFDADYAGTGGMLTNPLADFDMSKPKDAYTADVVGSYMAERDKSRKKKSVMSLFEEMKEFDK